MTPFTPLKLADQYRSSLVVLLLLFTALRPAWAQDEVTLYSDFDSFQSALVQAQVPLGPDYWPVNTATDNTSYLEQPTVEFPHIGEGCGVIRM